jgi:hypothetical protein
MKVHFGCKSEKKKPHHLTFGDTWLTKHEYAQTIKLIDNQMMTRGALK